VLVESPCMSSRRGATATRTILCVRLTTMQYATPRGSDVTSTPLLYTHIIIIISFLSPSFLRPIEFGVVVVIFSAGICAVWFLTAYKREHENTRLLQLPLITAFLPVKSSFILCRSENRIIFLAPKTNSILYIHT